jgi:hypothetical protein
VVYVFLVIYMNNAYCQGYVDVHKSPLIFYLYLTTILECTLISYCCDKISDINNPRGKRFIFPQSFRRFSPQSLGQNIMVGGACG